MNKNYLFNRSVFSKAKGHGIKRKSSKGLVAGIILAGAIALLGGSQVATADDLTAPESHTTSQANTDKDSAADSQTVDSSQANTETPSSENSTAASSEAASKANDAETSSKAATSEQTEQSNEGLSSQETNSKATSEHAQPNSLTTSAAKYDKEDDDDEDEDHEDHEDREDKKSDITFDNTGVKTSSSRVNVNGTNITITAAGTYTLKGAASGYNISVADNVADTVKLKLDSANLSNSTIYSPKNLDINILSNSSISSSLKNTIEAGGALYISSKRKSGLKVTSTAGHAIKANSLEADKVTLELSSAKDGINATSNVSITKSNITISAEDDGIQADDNTDVNSGDIQIKDSTVKITSTSKGITANDEIDVKGSTAITITSGSEGIEGRYVNLKKGQITINAGDDAINATEWTSKDDADLSHLKNSKNDIENEVAIVISGANVSGIGKDDGVDSNGNLYITDGSLKIQSTTDYSSAIDYDGKGFASGGTTWAIGHMGFAQGFSTGTKQPYVAAIVSGLAGDTITITDERGCVVAETKSDVDFDHIVFSSKAIRAGKTYTVKTSDGHKTTVTATKETTSHPSGRHVSKDTVPLLPNGHHPAFPGNGTPPSEDSKS
ncbi:carbohydrate-binding domain-containing protein [Streptococcus macacae]|uniref:Carbohydrate-binding domain-containing protein n=1 Tax=Streptococcus macacae NCTC 11558 TaxID=764298 RepID=G5JXQ4_9STRE|nr:carbohydrate-binding domain-containing protein [Streptococcus macacae]EHJ51574.1 hypothetical protein STRMA_1678 [Streptococcus macacae NCTC 11558]SUN77611.1 signal peptide [Streptococcus macacae NCTC 11558]